MAKINVIKPFSLNLNGAVQHFAAGSHEVEDATAEHWYVQAHIEQAAEAEEPAAEGEQAPAKKKGK